MAALPNRKHGISGCVHNGQLHVLGGRTYDNPRKRHAIYDPKKNRWKFGAASVIPRARAFLISSSGTLYKFGGGSHLVERLDDNNMTWIVEASMTIDAQQFGSGFAIGNDGILLIPGYFDSKEGLAFWSHNKQRWSMGPATLADDRQAAALVMMPVPSFLNPPSLPAILPPSLTLVSSSSSSSSLSSRSSLPPSSLLDSTFIDLKLPSPAISSVKSITFPSPPPLTLHHAGDDYDEKGRITDMTSNMSDDSVASLKSSSIIICAVGGSSGYTPAGSPNLTPMSTPLSSDRQRMSSMDGHHGPHGDIITIIDDDRIMVRQYDTPLPLTSLTVRYYPAVVAIP
jgi:hypothetical protein